MEILIGRIECREVKIRRLKDLHAAARAAAEGRAEVALVGRVIVARDGQRGVALFIVCTGVCIRAWGTCQRCYDQCKYETRNSHVNKDSPKTRAIGLHVVFFYRGFLGSLIFKTSFFLGGMGIFCISSIFITPYCPI